MEVENLVGKRFGHLIVIARGENNKTGQATWVCKCDCGKIRKRNVTTSSLNCGNTIACGETCSFSSKKHGMSKTRIYHIWTDMKTRCNCTTSNVYHLYGGRGIKICDEWLNDFMAFYNWSTANGYQENLTIDRIDVNGNYYPENCRWANSSVQNNNRRTNHFVYYKGEKYTIMQLSKKLGIRYYTLLYRIKRGWSEENLSLTNKTRKGGINYE